MTQISATALSALTSRGTRTEAATAAAAHELEGGDIRSAFEDLYGRDSTAGPRPLDEIAQTVMAAQAATSHSRNNVTFAVRWRLGGIARSHCVLRF